MIDSSPNVTVVVMTMNRWADLQVTLPRHEAPVIVVDNGSTDGTVESIRREFPEVRVVALGHNVGAVARTIGARLAATPYVAFADDDSWWAPGCLAAAARRLNDDPRLALAQARILVGSQHRLDPTCRIMLDSPIAGGHDVEPRILGFIACGAIVRRDAFLSVGGFDEMVPFPGEEARVAIDLAVAGLEMRYVPDLVVHHHPSPQRDHASRSRGDVRSRITTAVLRRPWSTVAREIASGARDPEGRRGAVDAIWCAPRTARRRRRVPDWLESELRLLDDGD